MWCGGLCGGAQTWARGFNKNGMFGLRIFVERAEVKFKIRKGNRGSSRIKGQTDQGLLGSRIHGQNENG